MAAWGCSVMVGPMRPKILRRSLVEFRRVEAAFAPYQHRRKVAIFGSSRTKPEQEEYRLAESLAARFVHDGFMVITGAGPGIMAAAQKGAGAENSFGLRILLPFPNAANETIKDDPKMVEFEYYFTRKLSFARESDAFIVFPGGLGTLDESFEVLTLMQTGKMPIVPVLMVERPGGRYWRVWQRFIEEDLVAEGHMSAPEMRLFHVCDGTDDPVEHIRRFYRVFDSYRWEGDELQIAIVRPLTREALAQLNQRFANLLERGCILQHSLQPGDDEGESRDRPAYRLTLIPHRRRYGELRRLIDTINDAPTQDEPR